MSIRLQVVMDEQELAEVRELAERHGLTVSEWTRQVIRAARRREGADDPARKLRAIAAAADNAFPVADIDGMLAQIQRGYLSEGAA